MRSYLSLVPISARIHRRQSRMTRICIILAVFLVTSIFSLLEMWTSGQTTAMRSKHGDWHIALQNMPEEKAEQIIGASDVKYSSWFDAINADADNGYYVNGKTAVLYGIEEAYAEDIMSYPLAGSFPHTEKEAAFSADAQEKLGVQIGDGIILSTPAGDFSYTISGFYEDDGEFNDVINGICVYMCRASFDNVRKLNGIEPASRFYIRFQNESGLKKTIADIKARYSLSSESVIENTAVLSLLGAASNEGINGLYPLALACLVIILIAGVFMISGCMNSNISQRTRFFGMLRCIGASKRQIIRFVRLEALNWCKTSIPIGCALGTVICWISCLILRFFVKGEWADTPLFSVSVSGILCGAAVGIITVFIAAQAPAEQAAKVSPAAAVSGSTDAASENVHAANTRLFKIETSLGVRHAVQSKKNLILMTGSFALTIVLFLTFSACLDIVHKLLPSVSGFTPDLAITSPDDSNSIGRSISQEISEIPGVRSVSGMMHSIEYPAEINGNAAAVDIFSHDGLLIDSFRHSVISGDISKVYGNSKYVMAVYSDRTGLDVGDTVKIGDEVLDVACVLSEGVGSISGSPVIVCSDETYTRLMGEQGYAILSVVLEKDASEAAVNKIYELSGGNVIADNRAEKDTVYGSYWVFRIAAYGFLAIISLITILNIMNSVSMGVSARMKQYGAMRAVGMECRQVTKMIAAEAVTYAVSGTAAGIALGLLLHYLIYVRIVVTHFGGAWNIPFTALALVLLLVIFSCAVSIHSPAKRIRSMAISETINEL